MEMAQRSSSKRPSKDGSGRYAIFGVRKYVQAIIKAHLAHHRPRDVNDFRNFGLLIFPFHFLKF